MARKHNVEVYTEGGLIYARGSALGSKPVQIAKYENLTGGSPAEFAYFSVSGDKGTLDTQYKLETVEFDYTLEASGIASNSSGTITLSLPGDEILLITAEITIEDLT